jgi:hypothetical protein
VYQRERETAICNITVAVEETAVITSASLPPLKKSSSLPCFGSSVIISAVHIFNQSRRNSTLKSNEMIAFTTLNMWWAFRGLWSSVC